jgi:hypothetical protein
VNIGGRCNLLKIVPDIGGLWYQCVRAFEICVYSAAYLECLQFRTRGEGRTNIYKINKQINAHSESLHLWTVAIIKYS